MIDKNKAIRLAPAKKQSKDINTNQASMKKIFVIAYAFLSVCSGKAQTRYEDSLKIVLATTTAAAERFTLIVKIEEDKLINGYANIDSVNCMHLYEMAQQLHSDSLLAISYNWIGNYFENEKGDYIIGLEYFFKAIPLAEKVKAKDQLSWLYQSIGWTYYQLKNPHEAIKYVRQSVKNLPDSSSSMFNYLISVYNDGMSQCFLALNQPDSALHYVQALNEANLRLKSPSFNAEAAAVFAKVYEAKGDNETAEFYYKKANILTDFIPWYPTILFVKIQYINFLLNNNKIKEAQNQATQFLQLGHKINNKDMKLAAAGFLRRINATNHVMDSAYYYSQMESALKDSIFNQTNINKIQVLAFREQIRTIEEEAKQKVVEEQRQHNIQYSLIALGIIIFVTLFLLLSRTIIADEKLISFFAVLGLLVVFEFINLLIHPWLAHFTNESPVLMLFALVLIAALLIPLHHRWEHWIKEKMVEKNKAIRLAAAKKTLEKLEKKSENV